jgi:hypothetical protein
MMNTTAVSALPSRVIALAVAALVFVAIMAISVGVSPAQSQEEGAVVTKEGFCWAYLPPAPYVETNEIQQVITPSGVLVLTCHFEGPPIDETYTTENFVCTTDAGPTTESRFVYTKSGRGLLTCRVHPGG